jgi:hypothetical protein
MQANFIHSTGITFSLKIFGLISIIFGDSSVIDSQSTKPAISESNIFELEAIFEVALTRVSWLSKGKLFNGNPFIENIVSGPFKQYFSEVPKFTHCFQSLYVSYFVITVVIT